MSERRERKKPKGDKLELVLQKATELGAAAFSPAGTVRSNDLGHTVVVFEIPGTPALRFGLVLVGKIEA